ncbi:jg5795 [Pararge aegeria aegeria]|uniref:Jg5795 protein n=1 Tax=Pararge aegeria aegeria TaxID=348720 RepID=A0A8S4R6D9_9NEOP|nr:jg5795 [Pararge aegeria aegeria]
MLKIFITLTLLNSCLCLNTSGALYNEVFDYHAETYLRAEFAYQVVLKIFNAFQQWFFTVTFCEFTYFENRILKYTETFGYGYPVMLLNGCQDPNSTQVKPKLNRHGRTAYIVTSNKLTVDDSDIVIDALTKTGVFKRRSTVIFVLNIPVEIDSYFYYTMKMHFELLWSRRITNSVIVLWADRLRMYTYNPFYQIIREITNVRDITKLLQEQYDDLNGRELRLSVFRKIYTSSESGPVYCTSRLAKTVMQRINATCKPLSPRDGSTVGDLLDNGTATGVTADLLDGYTDLELNSRILKNSYYGYIDTTYPLGQDNLCFLIKKSVQQSAFMTTLQLITVDMLILFTFNVIVLIGLSVVIRRVEKNIWKIHDKQCTSDTVIELIKCFIRQTVDIKFPGLIFRCVVLATMIYSLVVNCAIDGIITSSVSYPRYKHDANTISELVKANFTFGVHNRHMKIFKKSLSGEYYNEIIKRTVTFNDQNIKDAIDKRQFQYAILLRKSDAQYITRKPTNMENGRPLYHSVAECPVPCSIVYGLRYGSPYLPRLDNILGHLNQGGILEYWSKSDEYTLFQTHNKVLYVDNDKGQTSLNVKNLKEVFFVWFIGIFVSFIIFVIELLVHALNKNVPSI